MRRLAEEARIRRLMHALGQAADAETRVYFTGGASAVLEGWRPTTVDVDLCIVPDRDRLLQRRPFRAGRQPGSSRSRGEARPSPRQ